MKNENDLLDKNNSQNKNKNLSIEHSSELKKNLSESVENRKNQVLKIKCESASTSTGLGKEQFYLKVEISRQEWYRWSWGLEPFPHYIKIKLCDLFGKPFRDLFLGSEK